MATKRKRKRRGASTGRRHTGWMVGMRGGFKGIADSVTGNEQNDKYKWWGRIITVLIAAAAIGFLVQRW